MSISAFILVIVSAVIHASWNFLTKKSHLNKIALIWSAQFMVGLTSLPFVVSALFVYGISEKAILFFLATSFFSCSLHFPFRFCI